MKRLDGVSSFIVMDIVREAGRYGDTIHFEVGQPDLQPPPQVWEETERAIKDGKNGYIESLGLLPLREKIAEFYHRKYGIDISPSRIAVTPGTSGAFLVAYSILLDFGEKILLTDPSYPCYKNFAKVLGIDPVFVPVNKSTNYQLTPDMLEENSNVKAVHIPSPSNPTGNVYEKENLKKLIETADEKNIWFISDEIYHGLVYDKEEHTALEFSDRAIVISGFSKYFCMPGFRLGWIILPENLMRKAEIILQNFFISAPTISQYAALGAFDYQYLSKVTETFRKRRNYLLNALSPLFDIDAKPEGAFYIWANISKYGKNSFEFAKELLENIHVAVTPGVDFGKNGTENYIRFAYTRNINHLAEGVERLKSYLDRL
ncbi:pyridoxal phosphate-dependent aminotransferase [Desulfurobacterium sp.]